MTAVETGLTRGVVYRHARRPEWGVAMLIGQAEGKATLVFADGERRTFAASLAAKVLVISEDDHPAEPAPASKPRRKRSGSWRGPAWTPEDDAELLELSSRLEVTDVQIAEKLGRTLEAIRVRRGRIGGPRPVRNAWTPADVEALIQARAEGLTIQAAADRIGRTKSATATQLMRMRRPRPKQGGKR